MALLSLLRLQTCDGQEGGLSRAAGPGRLGAGASSSPGVNQVVRGGFSPSENLCITEVAS